ncbi:MAG: trypsin-like peptidase domain-containing protein [Anaerolineae bacterium]|nr:trypsin-like peptidase domain-containing protein [Anaerolineae bacterium]
MKQITAILLAIMMVSAACAQDRNAPPPQATKISSASDGQTVNTSFAAQAQPTAIPDSMIAEADAEYLLLTNVYELVAPSVVNIEVTVKTPDDATHAGIEGGTAKGSGFVLDLNGHIATNAHVVSDSEEISVTFNDGYVTSAELVGFDAFSDVAVVKVTVDASRLHPVTFADSDGVKVGERAIAIGNPFGLNSSMTVGIISGLGRQLPSAELISNDITPGFNNPSIIQVDTDINPGNSGGPLLNSRGEVIGINTAIRTESGIFEGVGFAVPAQTVQRVIPQLIENGRMEYAWLGITSMAAEDGLGVAALAEPLKLPVNQGVLIDTIVPDSPASKAGLHGGNAPTQVRGVSVCTGGDIIVAVNGIYVKNMDELLSYMVLNTQPGDTIQMLIIRGGDTFELPLMLEPRPSGVTSIPAICGG